MKRFYLIISILFIAASLADAQNNAPRVGRGGDRNRQNQQAGGQAGQSELSVRAQILNEQMTQEMGNASWMRVIYRELDLTDEKNAALYYPVRETNGMVNLFTSIFQLLSEGKIKVYKYLADNESFDDSNILSFKDMLDNFSIFYEIVPAGGGRPERYVINSSDVPSEEVKAYYVKEAWYFNQDNSVYDVKTLAISPIAFMLNEAGIAQRMPMFWVKYEEISPYIKKNYVMTSNINNVKALTADDYFRRRMYDGKIVKTENLLGKALQEYFSTEDSLLAEQQRIEMQLKSFNDSLWIKPDTTLVLSKKDKKKTSSSSSKKDGVTADNKAPKEKAPKQQPVKQEKAAKSSPARSIRRN